MDTSWLAESYPVQTLGLSVEEAAGVLRLYLSPPATVTEDEFENGSAVLGRLPPDRQIRLHAWALGLRDARRARN